MTSSDISFYQLCISDLSEGSPNIMECVSDKLQALAVEVSAEADANMSRWLLVICGALVFFMQGGFAALCAERVRKKNVSDRSVVLRGDFYGVGLCATWHRRIIPYLISNNPSRNNL